MNNYNCSHVEEDALACLECRMVSIDLDTHPCGELIKLTLKSLPILKEMGYE